MRSRPLRGWAGRAAGLACMLTVLSGLPQHAGSHRIDLHTGRRYLTSPAYVRTIPVGMYAQALAVDSRTRRAFVLRADGRMVVIDTASLHVVGTTPLPQSSYMGNRRALACRPWIRGAGAGSSPATTRRGRPDAASDAATGGVAGGPRPPARSAPGCPARAQARRTRGITAGSPHLLSRSKCSRTLMSSTRGPACPARLSPPVGQRARPAHRARWAWATTRARWPSPVRAERCRAAPRYLPPVWLVRAANEARFSCSQLGELPSAGIDYAGWSD